MLSLRFNHLLVVLKIYDTGSLSETARQLNLTISAASRSLRKCQEEFGDELFVRNYQGMAPTEKCRAVVPIIRKLLANFNDLTDTKTFAPADMRCFQPRHRWLLTSPARFRLPPPTMPS